MEGEAKIIDVETGNGRDREKTRAEAGKRTGWERDERIGTTTKSGRPTASNTKTATASVFHKNIHR